MNKYIIGIIALVVIAGALLYTVDFGPTSYVAAVEEDVVELEEELAEIDALVSSGELTADQAAEAHARIVARLESINTAMARGDATLSVEERATLNAALDRLKSALTRYGDSLVTLETTIEASDRKLNVRGSTSRSVRDYFDGIVESIEEFVDGVTDEFVFNEEEVFDDEEATGDENATTTDEMSDDEPTTTDDGEVGADEMDDRTVSGTVTAVDTEMAMVDGPYVVTILSETGTEVTVHIPSMGILLCAASEHIAAIGDITVGADVSVRGNVGEGDVIVPCESDTHYFRVN